MSIGMSMDTLVQQIQRGQQHLNKHHPDAHDAVQQHLHESLPDAHDAVHRPSLELPSVEKALHQLQMELAVARQMLAAERQRYQDLFDAIPDGSMVTDAYGTIWEANCAAATLLNTSPQFLVSKPLTGFIVADEQPTFGSELAQLLSTGGGQTWEVRLQPQNGRPIDVLVTVAPIHDQDGRPVTLRWWLRDLVGPKRSEEERVQIPSQEQAVHDETEAMRQQFTFLAEADRVLAASPNNETVFQNIARLVVPRLADWCMIDIIEEDGQVYRVEPVQTDLLRTDLLQMHQQHVPLNRNAENDPVTRVLRMGVPELVPEISAEWCLSAARDTEHLARLLKFTSAIIVPLVARGRVLGTIALFLASQRCYKPADLELAKQLAFRVALTLENTRLYGEAQAAIRARDEFVSIAAHELNNPICVLRGYVQLLQRWSTREPALSAQEQRVLQTIDRQTEHLHRLIMMLLEFGRIQAGRFSLRTQVVDLCELARRVVEQLGPTLAKHTIDLSCAEETLLIDGDEWCLELVLQNLLQNAIKYSPAGGPITVRIQRHDDRACLVVRDQGIGIPKAAQSHIFQRFYRACNVDPRRTSGFGIGLYLVKELVTRHGGTVEVSSTEGHGSTFTIDLPMRTAADHSGVSTDHHTDGAVQEFGAHIDQTGMAGSQRHSVPRQDSHY